MASINGSMNGDVPHLQWWVEHLKDATISPLSRDYPEQTTEDGAKRPIEALEHATIPESLLTALSRLRDHGTPSKVLLSALVVLVARLTGDEDISLGVNGARDGAPFTLRLPFISSQSFGDLMGRLKAALNQGNARIVPLQDLRSSLKTSSLFKFAAYETSTETFNEGIGAADLVINYHISQSNSLSLQAKYNQRLFSSARIAGILEQLCEIIGNASINPSQAVGRIEIANNTSKANLPDPTSDLKWSSFRGAIHDIFTANAEAHPHRPCVVETEHGSSPERSFSYQQINEASNIVAHHLFGKGIERGEVVMVYSHRGVDLVVAVMGILKAGATFSVLDPAYPPDRQNIYLEVAKPRALIIIDKATQDAGELSEKVRNFVADNLQLRTEIPGLALRDDGTLVGGTAGGKDIFEDAQLQKAKPPGIVVGPDSTPTLSFTSGSEGKPKGVRGRHYSLAYYFDWMAKTFNLSGNDKFTMLSGIAHDPIQRDMFTPLFLGAQLLVPSRDDIQNERLAEWMKKHGATVTHLTPAMGQILVGGASARFEALHHAFFVGDILIKRDCRSLQSLAPNVFIVNMYGTTETQRAVSYFEIPSLAAKPGYLDSMKDVIPAGRGMLNVQMLVVNRFDRTKLCAVGEIGEIYVRAAGLAEGYLGTPELTKTKFVENWFDGHEEGLEQDKARFDATSRDKPWAQFYSGARDRLYRSGDLGRYTPSGDVECSGRADDQVKIRGFRIELGEIDTHLSQHPLVRENVTLVRRDKFEEQTLVSYVVPQMKAWLKFLAEQAKEDQVDDGSLSGRFDRFRLLQLNVQQYLQTKLPAYAVPSIIVPMRAMPLNPNGKVDKPKLPFPDITMLSATRRRKSSMLAHLTDTELKLAQVWAKLIPGTIAKTIKPSETFFELGGNSMTAQQLPFHIRRHWPGVDISISRIYKLPSLKDMASYIQRLSAADSLDGGLGDSDEQTNGVILDVAYSDDAIKLAKILPPSFPSVEASHRSESPTVFLTGATGFLGAFILRDLLRRTNPQVSVIALVRAKTEPDALSRVEATCKAYGIWSESWRSRVHCIPGTLGLQQFGLTDADFRSICERVDVVSYLPRNFQEDALEMIPHFSQTRAYMTQVIHNGAQVHWINPYSMLRPANVEGTIATLHLCANGKAKHFAFVSSTSVLDTDHFVHESEKIVTSGGEGISEDDDLSGSKTNLSTGYGQSKWVAEYLVREAGRRGLRGCIIRPGYVLGDSKSGATNSDDFLVRMLKGCVQLKARPNINNTVNMVPVDHVARVVAACAFGGNSMRVAHVTGHPRLRFNQFLAALETYGYDVPLSDYVPWTAALESYVNRHTDSLTAHALMPLFTFVANDLPSNTRAPELDDSNAEEALYADSEWTGEDVSAGSGVTKNLIGLYLAYLVEVGFMPKPEGTEKKMKKRLPSLQMSEAQRQALSTVGGRGGIA
jgi:L-aminoadipate-semialdehyde dehydrogenase